MSTMTTNYGSKQTLTWGMTSPSSDTNLLAGRQSVAVDNAASTKYLDIIIGGLFKLHASTAAVGVIEVWGYGTWNEGSGGIAGFTADCTGVDGDLTLIAETKALLRLLMVIPTAAVNGDDLYWGPIGLNQIFGGVLPDQWGLWGVHDSGGALATSTTEWQGIKYDSA